MRAGEEMTAPDGSVGRILICDAWNTDIIDELSPSLTDTLVHKRRFSGFFETDLDDIMKGWGYDAWCSPVARRVCALGAR